MEIRNIEKNDIKRLKDISFYELGSDYLSDSDFIDTLDSPDQFCKVALLNGKPEGFCICCIFGPEKVDEKLKLPDTPQRDLVMEYHRIGLIDSVSVSEEAKGKGLGSAMVKASYQEFVDRGCDLITAMAWKSVDGTTNIGHILVDKLEMKPILSIAGYWNQMVDSPEGHDCPVCGRPCRCSAVLHIKDIQKVD